MKGLLVHVLRPVDFPDCTNDGVTSRVGMCVLYGEGLPEIFEESADMPALLLHKRQIRGRDYFYAVPADADTHHCYMAGGNFVYTSDSRLSEICQYPISVHDRCE